MRKRFAWHSPVPGQSSVRPGQTKTNVSLRSNAGGCTTAKPGDDTKGKPISTWSKTGALDLAGTLPRRRIVMGPGHGFLGCRPSDAVQGVCFWPIPDMALACRTRLLSSEARTWPRFMSLRPSQQVFRSAGQSLFVRAQAMVVEVIESSHYWLRRYSDSGALPWR